MSILEDSGQNKGINSRFQRIWIVCLFDVALMKLQVWASDGQRRLSDHIRRRIAHMRIRCRRTFKRLHVGMPVKRCLPIYLLDWFLDVQTEDVSWKPLGNQCRVNLTDATKPFENQQNQFRLLKWETIVWLAYPWSETNKRRTLSRFETLSFVWNRLHGWVILAYNSLTLGRKQMKFVPLAVLRS